MSSSTPTPGQGETPDDDAAPLESDDVASREVEDESDVAPREVEVESAVDPTTVRRAPRYKAFFWAGALAGIVIGVVLGIILLTSPSAQGMLKPGVYFTVLVIGTTTVTVLIAGLLAIIADRRSLRRR